MKKITEKLLGFPIGLHWTLGYFFVLYIFIYRNDYDRMNYSIAMLTAIYFCVLLHELGHVYVAKYLKYPCEKITMYMIGGIAAIKGEFDNKPKHELLITIAGPLVNLVIALLIFPFYSYIDITLIIKMNNINWAGFLPELAISNLILAAFNLLPIYPMDGGRIFRSILSLATKNHRLASVSANYIALVLSIGLAIFMGFIGNWTTVLISVLVFIMNLYEILDRNKKEKVNIANAIKAEKKKQNLIENLPLNITASFNNGIILNVINTENINFFNSFNSYEKDSTSDIYYIHANIRI
jgi:Zn-dependent protease